MRAQRQGLPRTSCLVLFAHSPLLLLLLLLACQQSAHAARVARERADVRQIQPWDKGVDVGNLRGILAPQSTSARQCPLATGLDDFSTVFNHRAAELMPRLREARLEGPMQDFNLDVATRMARITSVAYCSDVPVVMAWNCTRCQRVPGLFPQEVVYDLAWDLLGYAAYDKQLDAVVVAFRGTDSHSWGNWINNLKTWRMNKMYPVPGAPRAMVHAGFYDLWTNSALQSNLSAAVGDILAAHPTPRLFLTGHSMGGALGSLAALDLKFRHNFTEVRLWSFGSPRVGNYDWELLFGEHVVESWRFTHNRDVVPSLPPLWLGFHHVAREAWTVDYAGPGGIVEQKILVCDDSGEDPSCHNSACMLGLCTSVADHLMYLGVEMYRDAMEC